MASEAQPSGLAAAAVQQHLLLLWVHGSAGTQHL
jgi:hypothetical protein